MLTPKAHPIGGASGGGGVGGSGGGSGGGGDSTPSDTGKEGWPATPALVAMCASPHRSCSLFRISAGSLADEQKSRVVNLFLILRNKLKQECGSDI